MSPLMTDAESAAAVVAVAAVAAAVALERSVGLQDSEVCHPLSERPYASIDTLIAHSLSATKLSPAGLWEVTVTTWLSCVCVTDVSKELPEKKADSSDAVCSGSYTALLDAIVCSDVAVGIKAANVGSHEGTDERFSDSATDKKSLSLSGFSSQPFRSSAQIAARGVLCEGPGPDRLLDMAAQCHKKSSTMSEGTCLAATNKMALIFFMTAMVKKRIHLVFQALSVAVRIEIDEMVRLSTSMPGFGAVRLLGIVAKAEAILCVLSDAFRRPSPCICMAKVRARLQSHG
ncbi:hypothetical protein AK812_SmicGene35193 [Symbiodinium microadriaticum]|uniref:Uncharacterized protein n=1 Tax=Symbiodinium microadriaticum TaxID=2951 RepID=A0A1Q9CM19_SYMMI|nr:hypothetical protein AK812_SmicGene35193 [Symbiodinium microadriaticum]CAE7254610.1 unnamed protein product [Symbiodinium microadriaticum]CAE7311268.1 unnamed protein product [Symbiodinium sp. KB8]